MMKVFTHKSLTIELPKLKRIDVKDGDRLYCTPSGNTYPSITSILSKSKKKIIDDWERKIGSKQAEKIKKYATNSGTSIHELIELYLKNKEIEIENVFEKNAFYQLVPYLDNIDNIVLQETPLYSDLLCVAGTVDCIAEYNGIPSVIDFKTTRTYKEFEEYIESYFLQATAYSIMYQELTKNYAPQIVILMTSETGVPQVFIKKRKDYIKPLLECMRKYNEIFRSRTRAAK
jgi:genome maintenance exonuclease 1